MSNLLEGLMHWLKFETQLSPDEVDEPEQNKKKTLLYLKPEALCHVVVINDLEKYQSSPEFVEGGRLIEVSRQYNYKLRQVADLIEEPMQADKKPQMKTITRSNKSRPDLRLAQPGDNKIALAESS
jgi:hypothetical protein